MVMKSTFLKAAAALAVLANLAWGASPARAQGSARGTLHERSPRLRANYPLMAGHLCDPIALVIPRGGQGFYRIDMIKDGPNGLNDPYLILIDARGQILDRDDDSGGGLNARISRHLQPGLYYILATTYDTDRRSLGRYQVSVTPLRRLADGQFTPEPPQQPLVALRPTPEDERRIANLFSQIDPVDVPPPGPAGQTRQQPRANPLRGILIPTGPSSEPSPRPSPIPRRNIRSTGSATHIGNGG
jgi:hypothetical protein